MNDCVGERPNPMIDDCELLAGGEDLNECDDIDVHVGQQLKAQRLLQGLKQAKIAGAMGVTFQQLQKYERGINRISASRLYLAARVLKVPVDTFYEGLADPTGGEVDESLRAVQHELLLLLAEPEGRDLALCLARLERPVRAQVGALLRAAATEADRAARSGCD